MKYLTLFILLFFASSVIAEDLSGIGFICKNFTEKDFLEKEKRYEEQAKKKREKSEVVIPKTVYDSLTRNMTYSKQNIYIGLYVHNSKDVSIFVLNLENEDGVKEIGGNYRTEPSMFYAGYKQYSYFSINRINLEIKFTGEGMKILNLSEGEIRSFADCELIKDTYYTAIWFSLSKIWEDYKERIKKSVQF